MELALTPTVKAIIAALTANVDLHFDITIGSLSSLGLTYRGVSARSTLSITYITSIGRENLIPCGRI